MKDHKPQFPNQVNCRLINPTKSEIGKISKQILDNINSQIITKLNLRLLKNTEETIAWFKSIENKNRKSFIQLDIVNYYPSVTEKLLDKALDFAADHTTREPITPEQRMIIKNARKSVLHQGNETWQKTTGEFDVTMGAYDGAQVTDLIGLYILHILKEQIPEIDFGLYRDDSLGVHKRIPATRMEAIKKKLNSIFENLGLEITVNTSLNTVDFLDVTFNLTNETFEQYRKPNDTPLYINKGSNHPPHVLNNLASAINKRLSGISANNELFEKHKAEYERALEKSGHQHQLTFNSQAQSQPDNQKRRKRQRDVIRFNPPFNKNLKTQLGKSFLSLITKHFPKNHILYPIANRKVLKISYSCTPNVGTIMAAHNKKLLNSPQQQKQTNCNCKIKTKCPVKNECKTEAIIYKATFKATNAYYIGMSSKMFKTRFNQHTHTLRTESRKNDTALAQYAWSKNFGPTPDIEWTILKKCKVMQPGDRYCDLCISEKMFLTKAQSDPNCINKRNDVGTRCCHIKNTKLGAVT